MKGVRNFVLSLIIKMMIKSRGGGEGDRAEHLISMGKKRNAYRILVSDSEGMRPLGRPRRGWKTKLDLN